MKYASHLLLLVATAAVGVGVSNIIASGTRADGKSLARWLLFEIRRSEALEQRAAEISRAMQTKKGVTGDLIAKRLTLREAAEEFRQADELIENNSGGLVATYRTAKTEDELYRQVLAWARTELSNSDPRKAEEVMQRLEKERMK
ncbi:MAG TPA: hypothetical protein VH682_18505 [Gemmataceae bacterium]|jgi:hypothetical protein